MEAIIFKDKVDKKNYFVVTYFLKAIKNKTLKDAAWALAIGQSVGNPNIRNRWENDELFENHSCKIINNSHFDSRSGKVKIAFPVANIDFKTDGITHMLVQIMGGQLDIDIIEKCHVLKIDFPKSVLKQFKYPKYGIDGIRKFVNSYDRPLLGGIIKPKIGVSPETLLAMVKELVEGGVDFIKEDEIMSDPYFCKIEDRVPIIMDYINSLDRNVIYAVSIHSDFPYLLDRVKRIYELGGNAVHVNFWAGLGAYKSIRELDLPIFLFFQKSGDKILTNKKHAFHIEWDVICQLAGMMGVDFIHAGMWGGYMPAEEMELKKTIELLNKLNVVPSLSCGMQPGLVQAINKRFGVNYMANVGGAIHGHPGGTLSGAKAMRQAIDQTHDEEYKQAIKKWGLVE